MDAAGIMGDSSKLKVNKSKVDRLRQWGQARLNDGDFS